MSSCDPTTKRPEPHAGGRALALLVALLLGGCAADGGDGLAPTTSVERSGEAHERPLVPLDSNVEIVLIQTHDLDTDPELEQVIVVFDRSFPQNPMELLVVENDPERDFKYIAWRSRLNTVGRNTLFVQVLDLTADNVKEIVVTGVNSSGKQVITVFKRNPTVSPAVAYENIFTKAVNGVIEIQKNLLDEGFDRQSGSQTAYPIVIEELESDPGSETISILRSIWNYRLQDNTFVVSRIERLTRKAVIGGSLTDYSDLSLEQLTARLEGLWIKEDSERITLDFRPIEKVFVIGLGETAEIFEWLATQRPRGNLLNVLGSNILTLSKRIPLQMQMNLLVARDDQLLVLSSFPDDFFQGTYRKNASALPTDAQARTAPELDGEFIGDDNLRITFQNPQLRWIQENEHFEGGYSVFRLKDWILQIRLYQEGSLDSRTLNFRLTLQESVDNLNRKIQLTLDPVELSVRGYELTSGRRIILQKVISRNS